MENVGDSDSSEILSPTQMWGPVALKNRVNCLEDDEETLSQTQPIEFEDDSRRQQLRSRIQTLMQILAMPNMEEAWTEVVRYVAATALRDVYPEAARETAGTRCSYRFFNPPMVRGIFILL